MFELDFLSTTAKYYQKGIQAFPILLVRVPSLNLL